jgi:predicted ATPase
MRIRRFVVSNYRSLGETVSVDLDDITVLVGPNGSGKSNVVDVLQFTADCMRLGLAGAITMRQGINKVRRWSRGHPYNLSIRLELYDDQNEGSYEFTLAGASVDEYLVRSEAAEISPRKARTDPRRRHAFRIVDGVWEVGPDDLRPVTDRQSLVLPLIAGDARFARLADALRRMAIYSIFPDILRRPQEYDSTKPMDRHGANWLSILKDQAKKSWAADLSTALGALTNDIEDIQIDQAAGYLVVEFLHHRESPGEKRLKPKWFSAVQESDGTLRFAGIITALRQQPPLALIGVEEPELTVHPGAIPLLVDHLKEASSSSQVVITTHSPELLDRMETSCIRVVERREGATSVERLSEQQRDAVRAGLLTLGEVLRTEGLRQEGFSWT